MLDTQDLRRGQNFFQNNLDFFIQNLSRLLVSLNTNCLSTLYIFFSLFYLITNIDSDRQWMSQKYNQKFY